MAAGALVYRRESQEPKAVTEAGALASPAIIAALSALIVPSADGEPGATEAGVSAVLETRLASPFRGLLYTRGLLGFDRLARRMHRQPWVRLRKEQQLALLSMVAEAHSLMTSGGPRFKCLLAKLRCDFDRYALAPAVELFPVLRTDVIQAFYTSQTAWNWLGFQGPPFPHGYPSDDAGDPASRSAAVAPPNNQR